MSKNSILRATHEGELDISQVGIPIPVAVLEDGTRVLTQGGFLRAIGRSRTPKSGTGVTVAKLPTFLAANNLKPFIDNQLLESTTPIRYTSIRGQDLWGYRAELLPQVCEIYLKANDEGALLASQMKILKQCQLLIRGLARIGIIALVDEATGYQYDREKYELQAILKAFISEEILEWQRTFQLSFYKEIFRLWDIPFTAENIRKKPRFIGKLTNELVYKNMPNGVFVLEKLKQKTPKTSGGNYRYRLHQSLTPDVGREALKKVIYSIETLAAISENKAKFKRLVQERYGQISIPFDNWDELDKPKKEVENTEFNKTLKAILGVSKPEK